jgi:hypothetical protein
MRHHRLATPRRRHRHRRHQRHRCRRPQSTATRRRRRSMTATATATVSTRPLPPGRQRRSNGGRRSWPRWSTPSTTTSNSHRHRSHSRTRMDSSSPPPRAIPGSSSEASHRPPGSSPCPTTGLHVLQFAPLYIAKKGDRRFLFVSLSFFRSFQRV